MAFTHDPCEFGTPSGPAPGDATTDQLLPLLAPHFQWHSLTIPANLARPLALCQGMPRLTSYCLFSRPTFNGIRSRSLRIWHAPGPVPGDATTDKLLPLLAPHFQWYSLTIHEYWARYRSLTQNEFALAPQQRYSNSRKTSITHYFTRTNVRGKTRYQKLLASLRRIWLSLPRS
jgi:hypothetical protein